jgi:retron-type reverse transcriptase
MTAESSLEQLCATLAEDFLSGPWKEEELTARGRALFPRGRWWQVDLFVAAAWATYRRPPRDRPAELSATMLAALLPDPVRRFSVPVPVPVPVARRWPVLELPNSAALAALAELAPSELQWYVELRGMQRRTHDERLRHYRYAWRASSRRPARLIEAPKDRLKLIQRRLLRQILSVVPVSPIAHGYVPGRSSLTAADVHVGAEVLVQVDLASFFPSIGHGRVRAIFEAVSYGPAVAADLAGLCTTATPLAVLRRRPMPDSPTAAQRTDRFHADRRLAVTHLPQGAPTSPTLANLACWRLDKRLAGLATAFDAQVTRYADDITFSGGFWLRSGRRDLLALLGQIVAEEGFALARSKTRVTTRSGRQQVLGVVVNERRSLDRRELELLEAILTNCVRTGPAAQNRAGHPDFRAHLLGRLAWVAAAAPHKVGKLRVIFDAIDWT